ncbi:coproporphyrinogen III oxidase [Clostridia bacterium]|nr:coproporphyrinogen III oxidase [Clostridia bacterium]
MGLNDGLNVRAEAMQSGGVYIHIPYCVSKCAYCDFYSVAAGGVPQRLVDALIREIRMAAERFGMRDVSTIYIGGGTPSLLVPVDLFKIALAVRSEFNVADDCEFTVEVNPGAVYQGILDIYNRIGVNRLSVGVQAGQDKLLEKLGRIHTWDDAEQTIRETHNAGINNISVDLIYAIPSQTLDDWKDSLKKVTDLNVQHVSCYELTLEPGTPMHKLYQHNPTDESAALAMQSETQRILGESGILRYEISNYAKPNYTSRHNEGYWQRKPYIGFGPGAHSLIGNERLANPANLEEWQGKIESGKPAWSVVETLTQSDEMFETMMLGLRMVRGVSLPAFRNSFGITPFDQWNSEMNSMRSAGWMNWDNDRVWLTALGLDVHNDVCRRLMR